MSMFTPDHGCVEHSDRGSGRRHHARGFTASYGWASGNPHHVPRFHMSSFQRSCPRVDQKYGDHAVVRAPYASENTVNDAPVHNDIPNVSPQYHMSCYERPANVRPSRDHRPTWVPAPEEPKGAPTHTHKRPNAAPTQNWMNWKDSSLCDPRNEAKAMSVVSARNNSSNVGNLMTGFVDPRGDFKPGVAPPRFTESRTDFKPSGKDSAHVPHATPPQAWASNFDSSLSRRRNADSELSSTTPRTATTTAAQGQIREKEPMAPASPTTAGQEHGGPTRKSHSSPMGHQPWASSWDSSLCRKWEGDTTAGAKYTSNVGALIHGGA